MSTVLSLSSIVLVDVLSRLSEDECKRVEIALEKRFHQLRVEKESNQIKEKLKRIFLAPGASDFEPELNSMEVCLQKSTYIMFMDQCALDVTVDQVDYTMSIRTKVYAPPPHNRRGSYIYANRIGRPFHESVGIFRDQTFYHVDGGNHWSPPPRLLNFVSFLRSNGFYDDNAKDKI